MSWTAISLISLLVIALLSFVVVLNLDHGVVSFGAVRRFCAFSWHASLHHSRQRGYRNNFSQAANFFNGCSASLSDLQLPPRS